MNIEKRKLYRSAYPGLLFAIFLCLIKVVESVFDVSLYKLGIKPLDFNGLIGIVTSPMIHSDWGHLGSNTLPLIILSTGIFYFYRKIALEVVLSVYFSTGFWVWLFARETYHIGASGIIYGFAAFIFFSGIFRREKWSIALALAVMVLYGGMVKGIAPSPDHPHMSWESHLIGGLSGILVAFYYRKAHNARFLQRKIDEAKPEDRMSLTYFNDERESFPTITYHYKGKDKNEKT